MKKREVMMLQKSAKMIKIKEKHKRDIRMHYEEEKERSNDATEKCKDDQSNEENSPSRKN